MKENELMQEEQNLALKVKNLKKKARKMQREGKVWMVLLKIYDATIEILVHFERKFNVFQIYLINTSCVLID